MSADNLKVGDRILINIGAFDEQLEEVEDSTFVFTVSEVKDINEKDWHTQWFKTKEPIKLISIHSGEVNNFNDWIDEAWAKVI